MPPADQLRASLRPLETESDGENLNRILKRCHRQEKECRNFFRVLTASPPMGCQIRRHWRREFCSRSIHVAPRLRPNAPKTAPFLAAPDRRPRFRQDILCNNRVSVCPSRKASQVLKALYKIGWTLAPEKPGSHKKLLRAGWTPYTFAFRDSDELGPRMLAKIAKKTGLSPEDL